MAESLAGDFEFALVATEGPEKRRRATGAMHLALRDTLRRYYVNPFGVWRRRGERPLFGWATLRGDVGLVTAGTPLASRDSTWPGVTSDFDSTTDGLRLRLGYLAMMDGGWNELVVTRATPGGFDGRWESSVGMTTYRAAGYFCARRVAPTT